MTRTPKLASAPALEIRECLLLAFNDRDILSESEVIGTLMERAAAHDEASLNERSTELQTAVSSGTNGTVAKEKSLRLPENRNSIVLDSHRGRMPLRSAYRSEG